MNRVCMCFAPLVHCNVGACVDVSSGGRKAYRRFRATSRRNNDQPNQSPREVQLFSHGTILLWVSQQGVDHIQAHKFPLLLQLASNTICSHEKLALVKAPLDVDCSSSGQFSF